MAESDEAILFEQGSIMVTTRRFILADRNLTYRLSEFKSAELGHAVPRLLDWILVITGLGILYGLCAGGAILLGMPGTNMEDDPASPALRFWTSADMGWQIMLYGLGVSAMGALLYVILRTICGRCIVRAETRWNDSCILFTARDSTLVQNIVNAINQAIAARPRDEPAS